MIVFLDPPILISYLLSSPSERVIPFIVQTCVSSPQIKLAVPQFYMNEFLEMAVQNEYLGQPQKLKYIEQFAQNLLYSAHEPDVATPYDIIKTTQQNEVLDPIVTLLKQSDYIITGDDEMLEHKKVRKASVVSPAQFYIMLAQEF